jgi:TPP-dependent indolepyruvate ferredoxin oxidoreductase alpha subunit
MFSNIVYNPLLPVIAVGRKKNGIKEVGMEKYAIQVIPQNCTGCLQCQLACSELYTRRFTLHEARLQVVFTNTGCTIRFSDDCTCCGVCTDHCLYEALMKTPREAA